MGLTFTKALNSIFKRFPASAFFVVTTITPLAARAPQIEAAAASFKIVTLATSFGLILLKPPSTGNPSTTSKGCALAYKEVCPRISNVGFPSASRVEASPAVVPINREAKLVAGLSNCCLEITLIDPVDRSLGKTEYPVTTTSCKSSTTASSITSNILSASLTTTSLVCIPTNEKTKVIFSPLVIMRPNVPS